MEFYSPYQQRRPQSQGGIVNNAAAPAPDQSTAVTSTGGRNFAPGQAGYNQKDAFGRITVGGAGTSTDQDFQSNAKVAALNAVKSSMSSANPEDYAGQDELRDYYRNYLADLPGQTANQISSFDTQSQRGLSNLLSQHRTQNAGTGRINSRQYAGQAGDITSRATQDYLNGLMQARSAGLDQANKVSAGLTGVQNQDMTERKFQQSQGSTLSDLILQLMNADQGREARLANTQSQEDIANKQMWASIVGGGLSAAGAASAGSSGGGGGGGAK